MVKFGKGKVESIKPSHQSYLDYQYEDGLLAIVWSPNIRFPKVFIANRLDQDIEILWDKATYIDMAGKAHGITNSPSRVKNPAQSQVQSLLPSWASIELYLFPQEGFHRGDEGIDFDPILTLRDSGKKDDLIRKYQALKGKTITIILPFKVEETVYEYSFIFEIQDTKRRDVTKVDPMELRNETNF